MIDSDNRKRPITSSGVLAQLYNQSTDARTGTNFTNWVITVGQDELDLYEQGGNLSAAMTGNGKPFPDGKLIGYNGEVSIVTGGGKRRPFGSGSTFTGLGFSFCQVVNVSQAEYNSYPQGPPVDAMPLLTSSFNISPAAPYTTGQSITASFTIKNVGYQPITLSSIGAGGRFNGSSVYDMNFGSTMLAAGSSYTYNSQPRQLASAGTYDFFAAYQEENGHWAVSVPAASGVARGRQITVTTPCSYSISPSSQSFNSGGGSGSVSVTAGSGCGWTASSNSSFISVTSGNSGTGNGSVGFSVSVNTGTSQRTGTLTVAGRTFTVTQDGASCSYSINPTSQSFNASTNTGSVSVTASAGCAWTAASNDGWISITSGGSGSGSGTVGYSVAANSGAGPRTGTLTVAGQTFTVNQSGGGTLANDSFAGAQVIGGAPGTVNGSNVGATKETGEPNHAGVSDGASVWYRWQAPSAGSATFTTAGSDFDTILAVYMGSAVSALTHVASNDDNPAGGLQSVVTFSATAGTVYYVAVAGYASGTGNIVLSWSLNGDCSLRLDRVSPPAGRAAGGQNITLFGSFDGLSTVTLDGISASWSASGTNQITVTTPAHSVGAISIALGSASCGSYSKSNAFAYLPSTFTDEPLVAGVTPAKAQHIDELRQAVYALRAVAGLAQAQWTDPVLVNFMTPVKPTHINELRAYLEDAAVSLGYERRSYTDPSLGAGSVIKRVHVDELRLRIKALAGECPRCLL